MTLRRTRSRPGVRARITGWGSSLPAKVLTNDDLAGMMDTSDEWIRERTGIAERRVGGTTSTLAIEACRLALDRAGVRPADVDLLILATTTPDQAVPGTSAAVQAELGMTCGAHDLNAACSGFVYALVEAYAMIGAGLDTVLVCGSDALSSITDFTDRSTAILFADGAGAVVVQSDDHHPPTLLGWDLGAAGEARHILYADLGDHLKMDGREVFRRAVRAMVGSSEQALHRAGIPAAEIDWLVPHQANIRIIESAAQKLEIPMDRVVTVIEHTGNTSAGSIPLALDAALTDARISPGDLLLLTGFGAGMTWASAVLRWDPGARSTTGVNR